MMDSELIILVAIVSMIFFGHSLTTIFHEMGHAIPLLLFSKKPVQVYIGTYDKEDKTASFQIGRLSVFIKWSFFYWDTGMCVHENDFSYRQRFWVILGGPLASLTFFGVIMTILITVPLSEMMIILGVIYMLLSFFDFVMNLYPRGFQHGEDGYIQSDGMQLQTILSLGKAHDRLFNILDSEEERTSQLSQLYEDTKNQAVGFAYVSSLVENKSFQQAFDVFQRLFAHKTPGIGHFAMLGDIYDGLNQKEDALKYYTTYLFHYNEDFQVKNKKARILYEIGQEEDSLTLFQHSIRQNPNSNPEAYMYIGKILTQLKNQEAIDHLVIANKQSPRNPEILLAVAQLYEKKNKNEEAIKFYKLAKFFGSEHHGLEYKIETLGV